MYQSGIPDADRILRRDSIAQPSDLDPAVLNQMPDPDWQSDDGRITLYCGDCLEILPTLEAGSVDAVVTDPPYGISDSPNPTPHRRGKRKGSANTWHPPSTWDKCIDPRWAAAAGSVSGVVAWFGHWRKRGEVEQSFRLPLRAEIVWAKNCHVGAPCPLAMRDERIWLFAERGIRGHRFETSVWDEPIIPTWSHRHHKNEKPVALMSRLVRFLTREGETVLDPFMGSGTTGVACVRTGRKFIGIELDPGYFGIAVKRIQDAILKQSEMLIPA